MPNNRNYPVSGNREFGFNTNPDGSYTFYTRGVDRLTDFSGDVFQKLFQLPFNSADALWNSFQNKIKDFVNSHGGCASIGSFQNNTSPTKDSHKYVANTYQYFRSYWQDVKDVLDGEKPLSSLSSEFSYGKCDNLPNS
ncbi:MULTISPECIES: hypothetical protein [Chitinophagaceae]